MVLGLLIVAAVVAILTLTPLGLDLRQTRGAWTGVILIVVGIVAGFLVVEWWARGAIDRLLGTGSLGKINSRRRIFRSTTSRLKREIELDALDERRLEAEVVERPTDPIAVELLCERLRREGRAEDYAREVEYFLTLKSDLSLEEKCRRYNELADLYLAQLDNPTRARAALDGLIKEFPRSYQATLARQRIKRIGGGDGEIG